MKFITYILNKFKSNDLPIQLGRWKIENCNTIMNNKIDLSNEDHCGPCGQYALEKVKFKNDIIKVNKSNNPNNYTDRKEK